MEAIFLFSLINKTEQVVCINVTMMIFFNIFQKVYNIAKMKTTAVFPDVQYYISSFANKGIFFSNQRKSFTSTHAMQTKLIHIVKLHKKYINIPVLMSPSNRSSMNSAQSYYFFYIMHAYLEVFV